MRIEWTAPAETDLEEIFDYIARDAPVYAEHYIDRIIDAVSALHEHPQLGRVVHEAGREHIRELIHQSHRIIYALRADRIHILAIIHGRRDLESLPDKPWDSES